MTTRRKLLTRDAAATVALMTTQLLAGEKYPAKMNNEDVTNRMSHKLSDYLIASDHFADWLLEKLDDDGSFGANAIDMTCYHKSACLLALAGRNTAADRIMTFVKDHYLQNDGDFMITTDKKVNLVNYNELIWGYSNGWFALTAQRTGRFDISFPAYKYIQTLYDANTGGFCSSRPETPEHPVIDLISTAHLGMLALYMGDSEKAGRAAELIKHFQAIQKDSTAGYYLRMKADGSLIKQFPEQEAEFYFLNANHSGQFYFVTGYAIAFLATMYTLTNDLSFLKSAQRYFDFTVSATGVFESHFSHKLAWGASLLFRLTGDHNYREAAIRVADLILNMRDRNGLWFADKPDYVYLDQGAECGIWLRTIASTLA